MADRFSSSTGLPDLLRRAPITSATLVLAIPTTLYFWSGSDPQLITVSAAAFVDEPWRFVTSSLAHGSFLHIFFNLYWLKLLGPLLEERLHPLLFITMLLTIAVAAGAAEFAVGIGGVGLSGVVYGLFGFLWYANSRADAFRGLLPGSTIKLMVGWFFLCIFATRMGLLNIANTAHGVGCLMGVLAGWVVLSPLATRPFKTALYYALLGLFLLAGSIWRPQMLERFADVGYAEFVEGLAHYGNSRPFMRDMMMLEEILESKDWEEIHEQASALLEAYGRQEPPPPAVARLLYLRCFAGYALERYASSLADAERALEINPDEPGVREVAEGCRQMLSR